MTTKTETNQHGGARKGAGRKRISAERTRTVSATLTVEHVELLDRLADAQGTSRSELLRDAIELLAAQATR